MERAGSSVSSCMDNSFLPCFSFFDVRQRLYSFQNVSENEAMFLASEKRIGRVKSCLSTAIDRLCNSRL